jgi:hypothetical protein
MMSLRRVSRLAMMALATLISISCGQVYRPVVIPVGVTPPNTSSFHAVFGIATNAAFNPGTAMQIDVSGDSDIGEANMGVNPTHAAIAPNNARVYVASAGSLYAGDTDTITAFTPASDSSIATGLGTVTTISMPNVGPTNPTTGVPEWTCSYLPDFVTTSQNTVVYVANYGAENDTTCTPNPVSTDSVVSISAASGNISFITYLPAGAHPVALAETPDALNLYVVNAGNNTVTDLSPADLSTLANISLPNTPIWAAMRVDGQRLYVLTQGDGQLYTIRTDTNAIVSNEPVGGPGANFALYDKTLNRLYVVNPTAQSIYVFDATTDPPGIIGTVSMKTGANAPCPNGCTPVTVAALPDGSRFYVASYESETACPDPIVGSKNPCIIPMLTVYDANSLTVKPISGSLLSGSSLSLLSTPVFQTGQYAVLTVNACAPPATYAPGTTRFRMFTAPSADSSHVYVGICDAGAVADISTATDTISVGQNSPDALITDLAAPFSAAPAVNGLPQLQNPIFLLTGQ